MIPNPEIPIAYPHISIHGKLICRKYLMTLHTAVATPEYFAYLHDKLEWMQHDTKSVHWNILQMALNSYQANDQWHLLLFSNDHLPLQALKSHPHHGLPLCLMCQMELETGWHFVKCNHKKCTVLFTNLKTTLTKTMHQLQLHSWQSGWVSTWPDMPHHTQISYRKYQNQCKPQSSSKCVYVGINYFKVALQWLGQCHQHHAHENGIEQRTSYGKAFETHLGLHPTHLEDQKQPPSQEWCTTYQIIARQ